MTRKEYPKKLTVLLDRDLEAALIYERVRLNRETGLPVSLSSAAVRAIRAGLPAVMGLEVLETASAVPLPGPRPAAVVYVEGIQPLIVTPDNAGDMATVAFPMLADEDHAAAAARLLEIAAPHFGTR